MKTGRSEQIRVTISGALRGCPPLEGVADKQQSEANRHCLQGRFVQRLAWERGEGFPPSYKKKEAGILSKISIRFFNDRIAMQFTERSLELSIMELFEISEQLKNL